MAITELRTKWMNYDESVTAASNMQVKINIKKAREELIFKLLHGLFQPSKAQSLESWLIDGRRYTHSSIPTMSFPPIDYNLSEITLGKAELTIAAASLMRHILFTHRISLHNFPDIMQCFTVLLLGRPLGDEEFSTGSTIGRHTTQLDVIDWYLQMVEFSKYITTLSPNGFPRYWYSSLDDSEHNKTDRHALVFLIPDVDGDPSYKTLSTMIATGKDADSNAGTNFNLFKDKIDPLALVHYGGGFTNNASAAAKERNLRFDKVIERAKGIDNPNPCFPIQGDFEFGAQRLIVDLGDGFHIDNLAVAHAKAFGETERGEYS